MGREIKRVALDFVWPLNKVWTGYTDNPYYDDNHTCESCNGSGYAPQAQIYSEEWYGHKRDFDPIAYGSKLLTPDTPGVRKFCERQVDRSMADAAAGTACLLFMG